MLLKTLVFFIRLEIVRPSEKALKALTVRHCIRDVKRYKANAK